VPELPDVEGYRRTFARHAAGKTVRRVEAIDRSMLRDTSPQGLGRALRGRRFQQPGRRGKLLICGTDGPTLLLHFGMTGLLDWSAADREVHRHDRLVLQLDDGALHYRNMRKFGGIWLARDDAARDRIVERLGPDWLDVSRERFDELLDRRRGAVKAALMDQKLAAGLGNLTADEALWQARIDPRRGVGSLDARERAALYRKIQKVLHDSLPYGLVPGKRTWLTGARDRRPGTCPRCGARLERVTIGGRTTAFCPREQR
jgi:formamidopyrimidine-DNA glycosylase